MSNEICECGHEKTLHFITRGGACEEWVADNKMCLCNSFTAHPDEEKGGEPNETDIALYREFPTMSCWIQSLKSSNFRAICDRCGDIQPRPSGPNLIDRWNAYHFSRSCLTVRPTDAERVGDEHDAYDAAMKKASAPGHDYTWLSFDIAWDEAKAYFTTERDDLRLQVKGLEQELAAERTRQDVQERALLNCLLMANRESYRAYKRGDGRSQEIWGHVRRFCNEAGISTSILRDAQGSSGTSESGANQEENDTKISGK